MAMAKPCAFVSSSWINAWTLRRACAVEGVDLRVSAAGRLLPLPAIEPSQPIHWLFFTEESSLRSALERKTQSASTVPKFLPAHFPAELLDDKWAFTEFLSEDKSGPQGLPQWHLNDAAQASYPVFLKCRHSWVGDRKMPRGWVCKDAAELATRRARMAVEALDEKHFFLQAWMGEEPLKLLSVGGFFDADEEMRNLMVVTERVAEYSAGPSSSAAVVTVDDPHELTTRAARVLRRLRYRGPFELEFLLTRRGCLILELNPRFWMQHGLFEADGNALVRRYLGVDSLKDRSLPAPKNLLWLDGFWMWKRFLQCDPRPVMLWWKWVRLSGYRAVVCPSTTFILRAAFWRLYQRIASFTNLTQQGPVHD